MIGDVASGPAAAATFSAWRAATINDDAKERNDRRTLNAPSLSDGLLEELDSAESLTLLLLGLDNTAVVDDIVVVNGECGICVEVCRIYVQRIYVPTSTYVWIRSKSAVSRK